MTIDNVKFIIVAGTATNVGKTTISAALVRFLNKRGIAAVGFKPHVAGRLRSIVDFADSHYRELPGCLFGSDGYELALASPLTSIEDVDLVTPWQMVFYKNSDDFIFIRAGSRVLNNLNYYKSDLYDRLMQRPDVERVIDLLGFPKQKAQSVNANGIARYSLSADVQASALSLLLERSPQYVVVEAAGPFLPTWKEAPVIDHLLVVSDDQLSLFPDLKQKVDLRISYTSQALSLLTQNKRPFMQTVMPIIEQSQRAELLEAYLSELFSSVIT